jgi:hypothetical protein
MQKRLQMRFGARAIELDRLAYACLFSLDHPRKIPLSALSPSMQKYKACESLIALRESMSNSEFIFLTSIHHGRRRKSEPMVPIW